jgi:hypothetical protein
MRPSAAGNDDLRRMVRNSPFVAQCKLDCSMHLRILALTLPPTAQELVAQASAAISDGDVLMTTVRRYQASCLCFHCSVAA